MKLIYVDNAATTAMSGAVIGAMEKSMREDYGNPSSLHSMGQRSAERVRAARETIAKRLGCRSNEIYFTSGGTEADNWAIRSCAKNGEKRGKRHIISTKFEHHAVLHTLQALEKEGFEVTYIDVNENGIVKVGDVEKAIRGDTAFVTIMYANNEIGTIQPIAEIGRLCRENGVVFHTDAVQAVGHIDINVEKENIDMLSFSSHKFHGPKGIGGLYCRKGIILNNMIFGGAQERNKRAGTENVPQIIGTAAALDEACSGLEKNAAYVTALRDRLIDSILSSVPRSRLNGDRENRLPGNISFCFEGIEGESLLLMLDLKGICASSGSACTSGSLDPSHVLLALGLPHEIAHGSLRISLSENNTSQEVDFIAEILPQIVSKLREMSPVWEKIQIGEKEVNTYAIQ
ncbi:MAG: cysteine desulfurase NifS [Clostridiales bacterium]|nr:cysteine desulfurase NifS [Clostridiales bacterium]